MTIILIVSSILLDGVLSTYITTTSFFLPLLTLTSLYLVYPYYKKREKIYKGLLILSGIVYDLLYTNLLFLHAIVFFLIGILIQHIYKNYQQNIVTKIIYLIVLIVVYESMLSLVFWIFKTTIVTIAKVLYKITHSLIINVIYVILLNPFIKIKS